LVLISMLTAGLLGAGAKAAVSPMQWESGTLPEALVRAKASDRWVLVDVYTTWCGPCHELDDKVFAREDVAKALASQFVALRRDGEKDEGEALVARYHVVGYPTVLILDATGAEVDRLMGFLPPRDLLATLQQFRAGRGTLAELEKKLAATPSDEALKLEVATRHALRGEARAVDELNQVAKGDLDGKGRRAPAALLTLGKYFYLRGKKDPAAAERVLRDLDERFPASEEASQVGYNLGLALHLQNKDSEAREVLDRWIAAAPKDLSRYGSYAWLCYKNGFDRARGIEVAKKGLEVDPKDHGLWDTLAELYAVTGKLVEARDAEKHALAIKPDDNYYSAQLRRFGGGK
jgi:thioredoxin-like negative regulator of GroEL